MESHAGYCHVINDDHRLKSRRQRVNIGDARSSGRERSDCRQHQRQHFRHLHGEHTDGRWWSPLAIGRRTERTPESGVRVSASLPGEGHEQQSSPRPDRELLACERNRFHQHHLRHHELDGTGIRQCHCRKCGRRRDCNRNLRQPSRLRQPSASPKPVHPLRISSFVNAASSGQPLVGLTPCGLALVTGAGLAPGITGVILRKHAGHRAAARIAWRTA